MNKITFGQFLDANNLPRIGETVITPSGYKVEVVAYVFDEMEDYAKVRCEDGIHGVLTWYLDQFNECTWEGKEMSKKIVRHIPTQCCYYTEEDGKTVVICGARLTPELDGKFWEEVDEYIEKEIVPSNPYAANK